MRKAKISHPTLPCCFPMNDAALRPRASSAVRAPVVGWRQIRRMLSVACMHLSKTSRLRVALTHKFVRHCAVDLGKGVVALHLPSCFAHTCTLPCPSGPCVFSRLFRRPTVDLSVCYAWLCRCQTVCDAHCSHRHSLGDHGEACRLRTATDLLCAQAMRTADVSVTRSWPAAARTCSEERSRWLWHRCLHLMPCNHSLPGAPQ